MREFIEKLNSNKALKIGFCVIVAIILWFFYLILFPNKTEDVVADIIVTQKAPGIVVQEDEHTIIQDTSKDSEVKEQLDYKYMSNVEYIRVITMPDDIDFSQDYVEKTLRMQMANEMLDNGMFTNISVDQMVGNWKLEELESGNKKTAYFEYGSAKDMQYAAVYVKVGNNFVYAAGFARHDESKEIFCNAVKAVNTNVGDYIQQAREKNVYKED